MRQSLNGHESTTAKASPEYDLFTFFEMTPDLVCIAGKDGYFRKVNPAVVEKLGYTKEELLSQPITSFIHPEDREVTRERRAKLLEGKALVNFENRYITRDGDILWLEWTSIYSPIQEIVFAIAKDVTMRKRVEKEVEDKYHVFRNLATHFKGSIEEDRKYLAAELHEELAQLASVVKMDVDWIGDNAPGLPELTTERIEHVRAVSELLINTIRRISFSISPSMLGTLGLNATLGWLCKEFSILNSIPCNFQINYDEADLTEEISIDFFRICQESLMNVMRHARAGNVWINIEEKGNKIILSITDDGKGFDVKDEAEAGGLATMRKRTASIHGQLDIESKKGKGTRVSVMIDKVIPMQSI